MTEIALVGYENLLTEIQKQIGQAQQNLVQNIARQKVVMAWNVGKIIDEHLSRNDKTGYGEKLMEKLVQDTAISDNSLYRMRSFYQSYPKLPKDEKQLNWTHYQTLSGVKKDEERKRLENLVRDNSWTTDELQIEVTKYYSQANSRANSRAKSQANSQANSQAKSQAHPLAKTKKPLRSKKLLKTKLHPERGQLFSYPLIKLENADLTCIDCGFNFFREVENQSKNLQNVDVIKKDETYSIKKSDSHPRKFNTYKAYLDRVVDGDTIRVTIDLGFKTFHNEIIRLKGIDSAEIDSEAGKESARALTQILDKIPFLVVKTIKVDIYGRYVADVFFSDKNEIDAQKVADEGIYLNQLLLDRGLVKIWEG
jgi:endonuclease YncB( thermonuclease family)/rubrerythrin